MNSTFEMVAWVPGPLEIAVILIFGLLIFGKRLPEVGKSLGKSIVEFKKGLRGIEDDMEKAINESQAEMLPPPSHQEDAASSAGESSSQSGSAEETASQTHTTNSANS